MLSRRSAPGLLGVVHLPKSGGTAVRSALAALDDVVAGPCYFDDFMFGGRRPSGLSDDQEARITSPDHLRRMAEGRRLVIGHYQASTLVDAGCQRLAVQIREPRARLLSLYRYWQLPEARAGWGSWEATALAAADGSLTSFLAAPAAWPAAVDAVARQLLLSHRPLPAKPGASATTRAVDGAPFDQLLRRLAVVEWSNHADRFVERVAQVIGSETVPTVGRENETPTPTDVQRLDRASLETLSAMTAADSRLIGRLMADGLLERRSPGDLDDELAASAVRLGFQLA